MDNETWLIERGDTIIQEKARTSFAQLSPWKALVYCRWVADYGMRNAGDLDAALDLYARFQDEGCALAESLSLPLTQQLFSRSKEEIERVYFSEFESICDEIRAAERCV